MGLKKTISVRQSEPNQVKKFKKRIRFNDNNMVEKIHYEQAPIEWFSQTHEHISREISAIETDLNHPSQSFTLDELTNEDIRSSIIKIKSKKLIELAKNIKNTQELFISLPKKEDPYFTNTQQKLEEIFKLIKHEINARLNYSTINRIK